MQHVLLNRLQDQLSRLNVVGNTLRQEGAVTGGIGGGGFANAPGAMPAPPRPTTASANLESSLSEIQPGRKLAEKAKKELNDLKGDFDSRRARGQAAGEMDRDKAQYANQFAGKNGFFKANEKKRSQTRQFFRKLP